MQVQQLMTKDVVTCRKEDTLARAAQILLEQDCGCIPVVDEHSNVVGITTDQDVLLAAFTQGELQEEVKKNR